MGVEVTTDGTAATVRMGWTTQRNALGPDEARVLARAVRQACDDSTTSVTLTGEGSFCAGGKLPEFVRLGSELAPEQMADRIYGVMQDVVRALLECPVPTIAAIDGPAIGLGMDLALACDMRFVGPSGWLQQGWAAAGLIPGTGGASMLGRLNPTVLWRLLADQPRLDAAACVRDGLAEAGLPTALAAADRRAHNLAALGRATVSGYVALSRSSRTPDDDHFRTAARIQADLLCSAAFRLRAAALLAKR